MDGFIRGTDDRLYHQFSDGSSWSGWLPLGAPPNAVGLEQAVVGDPGAVSWGLGRLDVFLRAADNRLWQRFYDMGWSGWVDLGAPDPVAGIASSPDVSSRGVGRLDVFVKGSNGKYVGTDSTMLAGRGGSTMSALHRQESVLIRAPWRSP